jgi:hypothetical protein
MGRGPIPVDYEQLGFPDIHHRWDCDRKYQYDMIRYVASKIRYRIGRGLTSQIAIESIDRAKGGLEQTANIPGTFRHSRMGRECRYRHP